MNTLVFDRNAAYVFTLLKGLPFGGGKPVRVGNRLFRLIVYGTLSLKDWPFGGGEGRA